jgi:hypothetical protein
LKCFENRNFDFDKNFRCGMGDLHFRSAKNISKK